MKKFLRYDKLIGIGVFILAVLLLYVFEIPCIFKTLFSVPCPACGMTRACFSVLKGDFAAAFEYHSLWLLLPIVVALYWFDGKIFKREFINYILAISVAAIFIIRWILVLSH